MGLWTPEHARTLIPTALIMVLVAALLRLILGKRNLKIRMIPFQILSCVIVLLEIGKQTMSVIRGYDLYHLPFHFCSLFIFMLPVMAFYRGKHRQTVAGITAALSFSMFLLMLIYPNLIYSAWDIENYFANYFAFHTVSFHNVVMLAFLLILMLNLHEPASGKEHNAVALFSVGFCVVSASMAHLLKTNYANFYRCNIPVFETLRLAVQEAAGYVAAQLLYVLIVSVLTVAFVMMSYWLYRLLRRLTLRKGTCICAESAVK